MKTKIRIIVLICLFVSAVLSEAAPVSDATRIPASTAGGSIYGRVFNELTGAYLNNARVYIAETGHETLTNQYGEYRLRAVPEGKATVRVFYTGFGELKEEVNLSAGQDLVRDFIFTSASVDDKSTLVVLDTYSVRAARETDLGAIAINEQRFAANIKNVMASDAMGDIMDNNVGEFLKFMPGITPEYDLESGGSVASVSVRGLPSSMAVVSNDGVQLANTGNSQGNARVYQFGQVSLNNISRIELTKVPTPSSPADSMSGSINMISKSAFERKSAQLRVNVGVTANSEAFDLDKTAFPSDQKIYTIRPTVSFDYTLPLTKNLGIVLTGNLMHRYIHQVPVRKTYNAGGSATGASFAKPYLRTYQIVAMAPRTNERESIGLRVDWRITADSVLSLNTEAGRFQADRYSVDYIFDAGTNGASSISPGLNMSYGPDYTIGATGRGSVTMMGTSSVFQELRTTAGNLRYRLDKGDWRIEAVLGKSRSKGGYQDTARGQFRQFTIGLKDPVRVSFTDVDQTVPRNITVYNNSNDAIDIYDINNYVLRTAQSTPRYICDDMTTAKVDIRKYIGAAAAPAFLQTGVSKVEHQRDVRRERINWTYNGLDGNADTLESPAPYVTSNIGRDYGYGFKNVPWVSSYKVWDAFQANQKLFSKTAAQYKDEETFRINNSEYFEEGVVSFYIQGDVSLWKNRLKLLGGVRYEKTNTKGKGVRYDPGAVYVRDADGSFAHDPGGNRIRKPEAGASGSMEELYLMRTERGDRASRTYDGFYPSIHLTYLITGNFLLRAAYARTYGRPDYTNIIPNATINEENLETDPDALPGRINLRNTGLLPWQANNYDLSLEYYTKQGGLLSCGVFYKGISNFFGESVRIATAADLQELGLDMRYVGWEIMTQYNLQDKASVTGAEFNIQQSLAFLGKWGRWFNCFANATQLRLRGNKDADFEGFIPRNMNWGVTFTWKNFNAMLKWNYRGQQRVSANTSVAGYEYIQARTRLDASINCRAYRTLTLYINAQNVFNEPEILYRYGPQTPDYAKQHRETKDGVQLTMGIKGTF